MRTLSLFATIAVTMASALPAQRIPPTIRVVGSSCPVSISARQRAQPDIREARKSQPKGASQLLDLELKNLQDRSIVSVDLTVYGTSPRLRFLPVTGSSQPEEITRSLSLSFDPLNLAQHNSNRFPDLWIEGLSSVTRIALTSATYANGEQWRAPTENDCVTAIDGIMPVSR